MYGGVHELDPHYLKVCKISQVSELCGAIYSLVLNTSLLNLSTLLSKFNAFSPAVLTDFC